MSKAIVGLQSERLVSIEGDRKVGLEGEHTSLRVKSVPPSAERAKFI